MSFLLQRWWYFWTLFSGTGPARVRFASEHVSQAGFARETLRAAGINGEVIVRAQMVAESMRLAAVGGEVLTVAAFTREAVIQ